MATDKGSRYKKLPLNLPERLAKLRLPSQSAQARKGGPGAASYTGPLHKSITRQSQDNHKTTPQDNPQDNPFYLAILALAVERKELIFFYY